MQHRGHTCHAANMLPSTQLSEMQAPVELNTGIQFGQNAPRVLYVMLHAGTDPWSLHAIRHDQQLLLPLEDFVQLHVETVP